MAVLSEIGVLLHRIRVKLYPNYLQGVKGAYIARTNSEKSLSIEDVCTAMKTRGGFTGNYDNLVDHVRQYYEEVAYQLCDGYAVNNGFYSLKPNVGGVFESAIEACDRKKHPISFRFSIRSKLSNLIKHIEVDVDGVADGSGYIDKFIDFEEDSTNTIFAPGNQFAVYGHKIKIDGSDPELGLFFVPVDDPSKAVKVERIAENKPTKVTGIVPNTNSSNNRIEIRTRYSGAGYRLLREPRIITSSFVIEAA